jgi:heat shock protein HslJ
VSLLAGALLALAAACAPSPGSGLAPADFRAAVAGIDWELTEINGAPAPTGAGSRRATIRFDADTARVAGFSGCNRYFGNYTLDGTALRFGAVGMTKMACAEGMELERQLGTALEATRRYELKEGELTLFGDAGTVAKFVRTST